MIETGIYVKPWIAGAYEMYCDCGWTAVRIGWMRTMDAVEEHADRHRESHARATD